MTLVKTTLQVAIERALQTAQADTSTSPDNARGALAAALATAIDDYLKTGTVITVGSATTQTGTIS